jgi:hypothetical protein
VTPDERWWEQAKCLGMDPDLFTPSLESRPGATKVALATCDRCPVRPPCRDDMLEVRPFGPRSIIAGGWRWDHNGVATPHRDDFFRAKELIAAADRRLLGRAWPYRAVRSDLTRKVVNAA